MSTPSIDPVSTATALAAALLGPQLAVYVGPYTVVLMASFLGGLMALRRDTSQRGAFGVLAFLIPIVALALLVTVPIAEGIVTWTGWQIFRWILAPTAVGIGAIGYDWPEVGAWCWDQRMLLIEYLTKLGSKRKPEGKPDGQ